MDRRERPPPPLADAAAEVTVLGSHRIAESFRTLEQFSLVLTHSDGEKVRQSRDLLRVGRVAAVLPVDLARCELVLIRQFRLSAHLNFGLGDLVEIVAGYIDPGETAADAARRECIEEIGVAPIALRELFTFLPAPGSSDEQATLFVALVDASKAPYRAGAAHESEDTRPMRVGFDAALAALASGRLHNGYTLMALHWFALNRARLGELFASPAAPA